MTSAPEPSSALNQTSHAADGAQRAGRLACFCPPAQPVMGAVEAGALWRMSLGFACAVLAQTLVTGLLPLAGLILAPAPYLMSAPYMAMILGAAVATFPASYLLDAFGRKASFALGASHGLAGGLILAWALAHHYFALLLLGAFWLGIAQGFSLFYRHEAAIGKSPRSAAWRMMVVFGAGALAGMGGPAVLMLTLGLDTAMRDVALALVAALAQIAVLFLAVTTAAPQMSADINARPHQGGWAFWLPTLCGMGAWFGMIQTMLAMPAAMQLCGIGLSGIYGLMAWHVLMMYAPAFAVYPMARLIGAPLIACAGLLLIVLAHISASRANDALDFSCILAALALGWSLTTSASTLWLHQHASPKRWILAGHDGALFLAALAGAFASGPALIGVH